MHLIIIVDSPPQVKEEIYCKRKKIRKKEITDFKV